MADLAIHAKDADAGDIVRVLGELAGRAGMRELVVRAHVHSARLGAPGALEAGRMLAGGIENAALEELLGRAVPA
jgi:hypothetical protein